MKKGQKEGKAEEKGREGKQREFHLFVSSTLPICAITLPGISNVNSYMQNRHFVSALQLKLHPWRPIV